MPSKFVSGILGLQPDMEHPKKTLLSDGDKLILHCSHASSCEKLKKLITTLNHRKPLNSNTANPDIPPQHRGWRHAVHIQHDATHAARTPNSPPCTHQ